MKLERYSDNPILEKNPDNPWERGSVLNPSVLYEKGLFRMVYRATNDTQFEKADGYISSIGYAESLDGIHFERFPEPLIRPDKKYERGLGCEDPRVTKIGDKYFLYYTAIGDNKNGNYTIRIALATSKDFRTWNKHGIVGPQHTTSKAACLFPEKIKEKYVRFYTWMSDSPLSSIVEARFDNLEDVASSPKSFMANNIDRYERNVVFKPPKNSFRGAEVGAVPVKTKAGWLFIYCNANTANYPNWTISAALLDIRDPKIILAETKGAILCPKTEEETNGVVKNVTFPSGAVVVGKELYVYYGSGDQGICLATCKYDELMTHLSSRIPRK